MGDPTAQVSLALLLAQAERYATDRLDDVLRATGLTVDQYRVLLQLADGHGHSMTEVAEQAVLSPATLTRVVDRLSQLNLLHRRIDPIDRRRALLYMSHRGEPLLRQIINEEGALQEELEARLGVVDYNHLLDTLQTMISASATASAGR
ncbi:regulatory protein MarR [Pseudonocardia dioxanivorans CB1190]|uniref:Regulatory protein MarR n=1 Tax=Pseudonocardia dioxanivorans (strain ATCC 55486 / DSM 44775 / JCM 13855 / CB1190) TaxID=675635 RepID=F4CK11_PSEUX|nr:MarR family transcriptional regulator [Pseudonocardia dioxanivorans]AEA28117.1 regulatory protein MarR [Pseudonocardia dioxanivorans CB1190]